MVIFHAVEGGGRKISNKSIIVCTMKLFGLVTIALWSHLLAIENRPVRG